MGSMGSMGSRSSKGRVRRRAGFSFGESGHDSRFIRNDRVVARVRVHNGHRHERVGIDVLCRQRAKIEVGQRVAVDDQESIGFEQRNGPRRAAGRPEDAGLPRIAHRQPHPRSVADDACDRFGAVMQVEHHAADAGVVQPAQDARDQRFAGDGQRRFSAD
jgi:hypothetical protein